MPYVYIMCLYAVCMSMCLYAIRTERLQHFVKFCIAFDLRPVHMSTSRRQTIYNCTMYLWCNGVLWVVVVLWCCGVVMVQPIPSITPIPLYLTCILPCIWIFERSSYQKFWNLHLHLFLMVRCCCRVIAITIVR